jgi:hypothetical protein
MGWHGILPHSYPPGVDEAGDKSREPAQRQASWERGMGVNAPADGGFPDGRGWKSAAQSQDPGRPADG